MASDPDAEAKMQEALDQAVHGEQGDFKMTQEEADKMKKAFEQPEFRKMFQDYLEEISDPKNREEYETYLKELEGGDKVPKGMELVRPEAGFAIKTRLEKAGDKVFLNVVHSDKIGKPASKPTTDANGRSGVSWSLPHSVGQPRMEADRKGTQCMTLDVCFHPDTLRMATSNRAFRNMLAETTIDAAQSAMDRNSSERGAAERRLSRDYHVLRGVPCVGGKPGVLMMRKEAKPEANKPGPQGGGGPADQGSSSQKSGGPSAGGKPGGAGTTSGGKGARKAAAQASSGGAGTDAALRERASSRTGSRGGGARAAAEGPAEPAHTIVHRGRFDLQGYLDGSMKGMSLDVSSTALSLTAGATYRLDLTLPFPVEDERGSAKFDKASRRLTVVLRVQAPPKAPPKPFVEPTPESDQGDHEGRVDDEEGEEEGKVEEGGEDQKSGDAGQQHHQRAASGKKGEGSVVRDSETTALPSSAVAPGGGSGEDGALDAAAVDGDPGGEDDLSSLELPESLVAQLREARAQVRREREEAERARAGGKGVGTLPEAQRSAADETRGEAEVEAGAAVGSVEEHDAGAAAERPSPPAAGAEVGAAQAAPEAAPDRPQPRHGEAVTTSAAKGPSVRMLGPGDVRRKQTPRALSLLLQVPDVDADSVRPVFCDTEFRVDFVDAGGVPYTVAGRTHAELAAPERCRYDVSSKNVVVVLQKREPGWWPEEEALTLHTQADFQPSASRPASTRGRNGGAEAASEGTRPQSVGPTPAPATNGAAPATARGRPGTAPAKERKPTRRANPALFELD